MFLFDELRNKKSKWSGLFDPFQDIYEISQHKVQQLREQGYTVVQIWECEWKRLKETNPEIQSFVDNLELNNPLNPRDAFCGGRTNAVKLYHQVTPNQKARGCRIQRKKRRRRIGGDPNKQASK